MRAMLALLVGALALAASSFAQTTPKGTVRGIVTRGPITPVCAIEVPCEGPAAGVRVTASRGDIVAARTVTDADGRFAFRLAPGPYAVRVLGRVDSDRTPNPRLIRVVAAKTVRLRFAIDTGIR